MHTVFSSLSCIFFIIWICGIACTLWWKVPEYSDHISLVAFMEIEKSSTIHCASSCNQTTQCIAFIFAKREPLNCQLLSTPTMEATNQQFSQDAIFYTMDMECGAPDVNGYRFVSYGGNTFTYKIHTTGATMDNAQLICSSEGGTLFRLTSVSKHSRIVSVIQTCSDYNSYSYRFDGSNVNASDFFNITEWSMSNGDAFSPSLWPPGMPNNPSVSHCLCLWDAIDWTVDDCGCESFNMPFICEKLSSK